MRAALVLFVIAACSTKELPHARGALVFDAREAADVFLATEIEVMKSEPLLRRVREEQRIELDAAAVTARRRTGTMIVDVTVRDKDPQRAAELCNFLMRTYFEYRISIAIEGSRASNRSWPRRSIAIAITPSSRRSCRIST